MSARLYQTVGTKVPGDGWEDQFRNDLPGGGTLLDGAAADDTDGLRFFASITNKNVATGIRYTDDGVIPPNSVVDNVTARSRCRRSAGATAAYWPYTRLGGVSTRADRITCGGGFVNTDTVWGQDPSGNAWTIASVFTATFGVGFDRGFSDVDARGDWTWAYIGINFELPVPTAVTGPVTEQLEITATLNGTINPNGATATYPCSYYFEYGLTTAYGSTTAVIGAQTGSADIAVTADITGLAPGATYHCRLVCTNADQTVYGEDVTLTFSTPAADRFWLHEGHPTDGTLDARALVRWDTIGFDIASQRFVFNCPVLTRDEDD